MRLLPFLRLSSLLLLAGCASKAVDERQIAADAAAMPPNTVMLSQMMRELSAQPGFTEQLLSYLNKGEKNGAYLTPKLFDAFRKIVLGRNWSGLDRFPSWTIYRVTQTVDLGASLMKKGADGGSVADRVHVGPYAIDRAMTESLDTPSDRAGFSDQGLVTKLTDNVTSGDAADAKIAAMHAESTRLAEVMNRLSLNGFPSAAPFAVSLRGVTATSPQQLVQALVASGHSVTVADARYFANFGHFHYQGKDVEMPFWLDSGLRVPTDHWWQRSRPLLVPVAHAEYEWIVRGPQIDAVVTFYFGIDGRAEFRTNDQLNQAWVMGRHAHEYRGADAVEVTRLTGQMLRAYANLHAAHPQLPFGGYYTLGVCQDVVGAIEMRMTGKTTLFPNTAQTALFHDQPDAEITALMDAVPKDTGGNAPGAERIFGSLPADDLNTITVPGLKDDLQRTKSAWQAGKLLHGDAWMRQASLLVGLVLATGLVLGVMRSRRGN